DRNRTNTCSRKPGGSSRTGPSYGRRTSPSPATVRPYFTIAACQALAGQTQGIAPKNQRGAVSCVLLLPRRKQSGACSQHGQENPTDAETGSGSGAETHARLASKERRINEKEKYLQRLSKNQAQEQDVPGSL